MAFEVVASSIALLVVLSVQLVWPLAQGTSFGTIQVRSSGRAHDLATCEFVRTCIFCFDDIPLCPADGKRGPP